MDQFLNSLVWALSHQVSEVDEIDILATIAGAEASYGEWTNTLNIAGSIGELSDAILIHELVHALDDANGWYIDWNGIGGNMESMEALAYASAHLIDQSFLLRRFEQRAKNNAYANCKEIQDAFNSAVNDLANFQVTDVWVDGENKRCINNSDLTDVRKKLGLHFSCDAMLPCYQKLMDKLYPKMNCKLKCPDGLPSELK
jgi:hypothetical protein